MAEMEGKTIHSVEKAIRILDAFVAVGHPVALAELYHMLSWPKSTIHGLLSTMRAAGLIEQGDDGRYWLGLRLFEYGCAVSGAWDIAAIAKPYMEQAAELLGESVFLSVLDRGQVVTLAEAESKECLRVVSEVGARLPIHCTSQGRLFLAYLSATEARRLLKAADLTAYTPATCTDAERFMLDLETVREQGYAMENGEFKRGLRAISVPIFASDGSVGYAIGCVGLLPEEKLQPAVSYLKAGAAKISRAIGYKG